MKKRGKKAKPVQPPRKRGKKLSSGSRAPRARNPKRARAGTSPQKKAAITRKRKITAQRIEESIRAGERAVAAKKGARTRKRRRAQRTKRGEIEARVVEAGPRAVDIYGHLVSALERMRDTAPAELELELDAPQEGKTVWLVRGSLVAREPIAYDLLAEIFATWERDAILETTIHPRRLSWIRWDVVLRGKLDGHSAGGIGEWNRVISEARLACDPDVDGSLANRYPDGGLSDALNRRMAINVYFSASVIGGRVVKL